MEKIVLIGGGGHCISCIDVIEETKKYEIVGIIDTIEKVGQAVLGYPIIGSDDDLESLVKKDYSFLIAVGQIKTAEFRYNYYQKLKSLNAKIPVIISPLAHVSKHASIGEGTIIMHHVVVNALSVVGCCNIINTKALLEHEAQVGDFCHVSTNAVLNGQVIVGNKCFVGSCSVINNNIQVCDNVIIPSSSKISKNVVKSGIYIARR